MDDDKSTEPISNAEENQDSVSNIETQENVTINAPSNNNSTEDSDKLKKAELKNIELKTAWENWWNTYQNTRNVDNSDDNNKKKQIDAQIKFMALYKEEKQSRENLANISQKKDPTSNNNPVGGKSRKNKGKCKGKTKRNTKRKFRNVSSKYITSSYLTVFNFLFPTFFI